jgi:anti-sigma factor RsiW
MVASVTDNDELQLNAYCDGELDLASAASFERRLADDELLRAQYTRLMSLRSVRAGPAFCVNEAGRFGPWPRRRCLVP